MGLIDLWRAGTGDRSVRPNRRQGGGYDRRSSRATRGPCRGTPGRARYPLYSRSAAAWPSRSSSSSLARASIVAKVSAVCAILPGASGENPMLRRNSPCSPANNSFENRREIPSLSAGIIPGAADGPQFDVVIFCGGRPSGLPCPRLPNQSTKAHLRHAYPKRAPAERAEFKVR